MTENIRKQFDTEIRAVRDRVRRFTISTAAVDRDGDTINPAGWRLDNFRKNPVVLWAHDYSQLPLAQAVDIRLENNNLVADAEFADHEFANTVLKLIDGKFLRATSVGFRPVKFVRNEQRGGVDFIEQELLEFSVTPVPANPEALRHIKAALRHPEPLVLELSDGGDGGVLELADEDPVAELRGDLAAQVRAGALAGLRARGYVPVGDPPVDPAERHYIEGLLRAAVREGISSAVREATESTIARLRGRVD